MALLISGAGRLVVNVDIRLSQVSRNFSYHVQFAETVCTVCTQ
jgi:hypothetical protein